MTGDSERLLTRFERFLIAPADFGHAEHVRVALEMLDAYDFIDACLRYARTIRAMAERAGVPEKFNTTITYAFMSLIAERRALAPDADFETFIAINDDLMDRDILLRWYSPERLRSTAAHRQFLLPDQATAPTSG